MPDPELTVIGGSPFIEDHREAKKVKQTLFYRTLIGGAENGSLAQLDARPVQLADAPAWS